MGSGAVLQGLFSKIAPDHLVKVSPGLWESSQVCPEGGLPDCQAESQIKWLGVLLLAPLQDWCTLWQTHAISLVVRAICSRHKSCLAPRAVRVFLCFWGSSINQSLFKKPWSSSCSFKTRIRRGSSKCLWLNLQTETSFLVEWPIYRHVWQLAVLSCPFTKKKSSWAPSFSKHNLEKVKLERIKTTWALLESCRICTT